MPPKRRQGEKLGKEGLFFSLNILQKEEMEA